MRFTVRVIIFIAIVGVIADSQVLLGQRQGGPNQQGRQGGPGEGPGRGGRGGGFQGGRGDAPRDRPQQRANGTASIRGRVINLTTGTPIRRATVRTLNVAV